MYSLYADSLRFFPHSVEGESEEAKEKRKEERKKRRAEAKAAATTKKPAADEAEDEEKKPAQQKVDVRFMRSTVEWRLSYRRFINIVRSLFLVDQDKPTGGSNQVC